MSASIQKNPRTKTPEEKLAFDEAHRLTPKEFNDLIDLNIKIAMALFTLGKLLDKGGPGSKLIFETTTGKQEFDRKALGAAQRAYIAKVRDLKAVFRISRKTLKTKPVPESFKGVYGAVYMAPALRAFFTPAEDRKGLFGLVDLGNGQQGYLIDQLPVLSAGFAQRNTISTLFHIYATTNNLHAEDNGQKIMLEQHFAECFGSDAYPVPFFKQAGAVGKVPDDVVESTFDAIIRGGFQEKSGTKDKQVSEPFNPIQKGYYLMTSFSNVSSLNYYNMSLIASNGLVNEAGQSILELIESPEYRQAMVNETAIVDAVKNASRAARLDVQNEKKKRAKAAKKAADKAAGIVTTKRKTKA